MPESVPTARDQWHAFFQQHRNSDNNVPDGNRPVVLSVENLRLNTHWGDILLEKPESVTRVYSMNVNGLSLDRRGGKFATVCQVQREVQADVLCGQEHNLDSDKTQVRSILFHTVQQYWTRSKITFGTTPIVFTSMYKPGGTFVITTGDLTGRVIKQTNDKWGRWVSHVYKGRGELSIAVISAYQVVNKLTTPGTITAASQQQSLLFQSNDVITNPRLAFCRDLQVYIQECRAHGSEILLVGDFNEAFGADSAGMASLATSCNLLDLMRIRHSSTDPATYSRGRTRLDYSLATGHVARALVKAGYEPFNSRFHTDHRASFMDFDTALLFGTATQQLGAHAPRILKSNNVSQVTQYIKAKYELLLAHNVFARAERMTSPGNRHAYAERLDKDIVSASLSAEQQMKRFGEPAWSVALVQARKKEAILSKCLTMARTNIDHTEQLRRDVLELNAAEEPFILPTTLQECTQALRKAKSEVKEIVSQSFVHRDKEHEDRIKALESTLSTQSDKTRARILRRIRKAEDIKQLFRKLKMVRRTHDRRGVTRIEIPLHPEQEPQTCSEWQTIDVPTEVLRHLQQRNQLHFGQAAGTPFTLPPLSDHLGFCGDGVEADNILDGSFDTTRYTPNVAILLRHLQQTEAMASMGVYPTITEDQYVQKLKVWTESTSTSPSGLHLGHYKALIARHRYSESSEDDSEEENSNREEWNFMQNKLLTLHVTMLNYALERGYAYDRWKQVTNTILFKDKDNVRLHRTRVIHIYEADYNLTLGIKWRAALHQAEALQELNEGQYGSRPHRNAVDPVLIEELQFEIARATRKVMIQTNYDATSCYDRIIPNLAMLVSRKYGVSKMTMLTNAKTLEQAEYCIRTELGVSPAGYTHNAENPIYGTGQGSGNSPMIWCFLSSVLFDCYDELVSILPTGLINPKWG
jgi:exonuclease III